MVLDTVEYIPIGSRSKCNFLDWCSYGLAKKREKDFNVHNQT